MPVLEEMLAVLFFTVNALEQSCDPHILILKLIYFIYLFMYVFIYLFIVCVCVCEHAHGCMSTPQSACGGQRTT